MDSAAPLALQIGQVLARDYRVLRGLAAGGMGSVYLVEQLSTGKQRALKVMHPQYARDEESRARFAQEARAGARIRSEHVVEVVAAGVDDETGIPWLAMELLDGEELSLRVRRGGRLPPGEVLEIFRQLGHGLGEAHRQGLVHRDLKPENIFIAVARRQNTPFTLKILDFGVAKLAQENQNNEQTEGTRPIGTPRWMAPEQSEERAHITPATDVWAMGLIAFYLLTGRLYWRAANGSGSMTSLLRELVLEPLEPPSARALALGFTDALPAEFDGWFARCVVRDAKARFPDADAALSALVPLLERAPHWDPASHPVPSSQPELPAGGTLLYGSRDAGDDATLPQGALAGGATLRNPSPNTPVGLGASAATAPQGDEPTLAFAKPAPPPLQAVPSPPQTASAQPLIASVQAAPIAPAASTAQPVASKPRSSLPLLAGAALALVAVACIAFAMRSRGSSSPAPITAPIATPAAPSAALLAPANPPPVAPLPAPAANPAQIPDSFSLTLDSVPSGAAVFDGETKLGETPLQLTLENGPLRTSPRRFRLVKEGYAPSNVLQGPSAEGVKLIETLGPVLEAEPAQKPGPRKPRREATPSDEPAPELRLSR